VHVATVATSRPGRLRLSAGFSARTGLHTQALEHRLDVRFYAGIVPCVAFTLTDSYDCRTVVTLFRLIYGRNRLVPMLRNSSGVDFGLKRPSAQLPFCKLVHYDVLLDHFLGP